MFFPIDPDKLPEGLIEAMRASADQADMETESFHAATYHLFDELTVDQLVTLNRMLHIIAQGAHSMLAAFYEGQVQAVLKYKFNVCPVHGVDHSQEALSEMGNEQKAEEQETSFPEFGSPEHTRLMEEYNLTFDINPETNLPIFRCSLCSLIYRSLEDRMLKPNDHCDGCIQKAQWG